jgi:hypothetical protein
MSEAKAMQTYVEVAGIVGILLLRVGTPLLVIALLTWSLRRLDARWQREAQQARLQTLDASLPVIPDATVDGRPCWEQRGCSAERREECAAYSRPTVACWQARTEVEGVMPSGCTECGIYHVAHPALAHVTLNSGVDGVSFSRN